MHSETHNPSATFTVRRPISHAIVACAVLGFVFAAAFLVGSSNLQAGDGPQSPSMHAPALRIGVYDSRAVAVAYVRSDLSNEKLQGLMRQRADAEKAGDAKRISELNELGESLQIRRHLQGFSNAPVDDILELVKDQLPLIAQQQGVVLITAHADYHDDKSVEVVDVTDALVQLFGPDARTLKMIKDLRKLEPEAIESVAQMPAVK